MIGIETLTRPSAADNTSFVLAPQPTSSSDEFIRAHLDLSPVPVRLSLRRDGPTRACMVHQRVS